jgi:hypothetical protein
VRNLVDHYEELGLPVLRLLAQEDRSPALHALADQGRAYHAGWFERVFAPALAGLRGAQRSRFPLVPILAELRRRGHQVALRTLAVEVAAMRARGFDAAPISDRVEAIAHDDWRAGNPRGRTRCWSTSTPGGRRPPPRPGPARGRRSAPTRCRCAQPTRHRSGQGCRRPYPPPGAGQRAR